MIHQQWKDPSKLACFFKTWAFYCAFMWTWPEHGLSLLHESQLQTLSRFYMDSTSWSLTTLKWTWWHNPYKYIHARTHTHTHTHTHTDTHTHTHSTITSEKVQCGPQQGQFSPQRQLWSWTCNVDWQHLKDLYWQKELCFYDQSALWFRNNWTKLINIKPEESV